MNKKLKECEKIAKEYCKRNGYKFIFANDCKFGFEDKKNNLWTLTYLELYDILKEEKEGEK